MKNYEEKEKKLDQALTRLNNLTGTFSAEQEDVNSLNIQKNHLISEKKIIEEKYEKLIYKHDLLKQQLQKLNEKLEKKFNLGNKFDQKVDELNQETDLLLSEIDKWQT